MITKTNKGFTLLELIIALSMFSIISVPLFGFTAYSLKIAEQLAVKNYLLENARITLDFITTEIRLAEELDFVVIDDDNTEFSVVQRDVDANSIFTLSKIKMKGITPGNTSVIVYNLTKDKSNIKYHRVDFGGRNTDDGEEIISHDNISYRVGELSRYIADIKLAFDFNSDIVYIKVVSDDRIDLGGEQITTPIILEGTVNLSNKIIRKI